MNQLVAVRLKEMLADVLSVIKIPTFQIIILQVNPFLKACGHWVLEIQNADQIPVFWSILGS